MNLSDNKYNRFSLIREMLETPELIRRFDISCIAEIASLAAEKKALFLTGEGSSRIFPARKAVYKSLRSGLETIIFTEGSKQASEYNLKDFAVFGSSNSGRTRELVELFEILKKEGHSHTFGITAAKNNKLDKLTSRTYILKCGTEKAVAASKSVIEQALFYDALLCELRGQKISGLESLADLFEDTLSMTIGNSIVKALSEASLVYFSGRNNGVAEELTLKTNEIIRKKAEYLEGTYAVHGIEEVMDKKEVLVWINPFRSEVEKYSSTLSDGVGIEIIAISTWPTPFPTILIPDGGEHAEYLELAAGWNLLVEAGLECGINIDKPTRARKIGNEF